MVNDEKKKDLSKYFKYLYSAFLYAKNEKLNIIFDEDFLSHSVAADKDREAVKEASNRGFGRESDLPR